jgi:hypothetical protein
MGYAPLLIGAAVRWPARTIKAAAVYYCVRFNSSTWRSTVRRLVEYGSSKRPRLIRAQKAPYDPKKQYLLAAHPHGILNYGWFNLFARARDGISSLVDGVQLIMCMAPAVQFYPLYGEILEHRGTDASAATIRRVLREGKLTPALIPGGFSEACWTNAEPDVEYAYSTYADSNHDA